MKPLPILLCLFWTTAALAGCGQPHDTSSAQALRPSTNGRVGGPFENAEFFYIGMPDSIASQVISPGWTQDGQKLLITGRILQNDGRTPAPGVVLYFYHTDVTGRYAPREDLDRRVVRHGYIRGWVKSDELGRYAIRTVRPAPYPGMNEPAHIHPAIKEANLNEYYIDEFVFDDDPLLTPDRRRRLENRGGSGVLRLVQAEDMQIAEHDIVLGLNVPGYPGSTERTSGREIGEEQPSFMPFHAWGPDRGSRACPVCKYGRHQGVILFVGDRPDWPSVERWLEFLEAESAQRGDRFKAYLVYGNARDFDAATRRKELEAVGRRLGIQKMALTFVPSLTDEDTEVNLSRIDPQSRNTIVLYRQRTVVDKFVDAEASPTGFAAVIAALDRTESDYADLP